MIRVGRIAQNSGPLGSCLGQNQRFEIRRFGNFRQPEIALNGLKDQMPVLCRMLSVDLLPRSGPGQDAARLEPHWQRAEQQQLGLGQPAVLAGWSAVHTAQLRWQVCRPLPSVCIVHAHYREHAQACVRAHELEERAEVMACVSSISYLCSMCCCSPPARLYSWPACSRARCHYRPADPPGPRDCSSSSCHQASPLG